MAYRVDHIQTIDIGRSEPGYGFNVCGDHGRPIVSFSYSTKEEAERGLEHVAEAVRLAIGVLAAWR